jgi:hypothetical protein
MALPTFAPPENFFAAKVTFNKSGTFAQPPV